LCGGGIPTHLHGTTSNRFGQGALVTVEAGGHRQAAEVTNVASYLSSNDIRLHLGLGAATSASRITIRWPSGKTQTLTNVAANQIVNVQEP
jgi:hypothetical protein